jgi:transposase
MAGILVGKYRRYSEAERRAIVAECEAPGASVARIARSHDLNANQVFRWRKQLRGVATVSEPKWLPVMPIEPVPAQPEAAAGQLELILASGHRVRINGEVPMPALEACLRRLLP